MKETKELAILIFMLFMTVIALNGGFDNTFETIDRVFSYIFLLIAGISFIKLMILSK